MHIKPRIKVKKGKTKGESSEISRRKIRRKSRATKKSRKIKNWHTDWEKSEWDKVGQLLRYPLSTHTQIHTNTYTHLALMSFAFFSIA